MKKIKIIFAYMLIISLWVCYFIVLFKGINPQNVCDEYRLYFIDKRIQTWPIHGSLKYKLGQEEYTDDYELLKRRSKETEVEDNKIYAEDNSAEFYFTAIPLLENLKLKISFFADFWEDKEIMVAINDTKIGSFNTQGNDIKDVIFDIPLECLSSNGINYVQLCAEDTYIGRIYSINIYEG